MRPEQHDADERRPRRDPRARVRALLLAGDPALRARLMADNLRRMRVAGLIAAAVSAVHLAVFVPMVVEGVAAQQWRSSMIAAHLVLLGVGLFVGSSAGRLAHHVGARPRTASALTALLLVVVLLAGGAIATADQLVTSAITPFLVANAIAGAVLVIPPLWALTIYPLGVVIFAVTLPLVQVDASVLVSNQVNGLTAGAIGMGLALSRWSVEVRQERLRRRIAAQQTELERRNEELDRLASHDPLTACLNRRAFELLFAQQLVADARSGSTSSLLLLDIDRFKRINDRFGHPAGDQVLVALADLLRDRGRSVDVVARWGGEEFAVLLPGADVVAAASIAQRLRAQVTAQRFPLTGVSDGSSEVQVTVSIGVAAVAHGPADPLGDVYRRADDALFRAKHAGRDQVVVDGGSPADQPSTSSTTPSTTAITTNPST